LRRKRFTERNGSCAFRAGLGQDHSLGRARLDSSPRVDPAAFDDRIGADRAQRLDDIARRMVGNNGERLRPCSAIAAGTRVLGVGVGLYGGR